MPERIIIDPVTRIEGHARISIFLSEDGGVRDAVFHVTEHFAYHLGQIILVSKMFAPGGVHFYEDAAGLAHPLWHK